jgi:hypothetical protein
LFADEEFLQTVEQHRVVRGSVLRLQSSEHLFQDGQGPSTLVKAVSAQCFRELKIGDLRLEQLVEGDMWTALVPLNAASAMLLTSQETFERHKQVRTQTTLLAPDRLQIFVFEQARKKFLNQILCFFSSKAVSPDKSVKRSPISATEYFKCSLCSGRFALRLQDNAPIGGPKRQCGAGIASESCGAVHGAVSPRKDCSSPQESGAAERAVIMRFTSWPGPVLFWRGDRVHGKEFYP